jgi:hypothetical protein
MLSFPDTDAPDPRTGGVLNAQPNEGAPTLGSGTVPGAAVDGEGAMLGAAPSVSALPVRWDSNEMRADPAMLAGKAAALMRLAAVADEGNTTTRRPGALASDSPATTNSINLVLRTNIVPTARVPIDNAKVAARLHHKLRSRARFWTPQLSVQILLVTMRSVCEQI